MVAVLCTPVVLTSYIVPGVNNLFTPDCTVIVTRLAPELGLTVTV